jgi:hypothetical protein
MTYDNFAYQAHVWFYLKFVEAHFSPGYQGPADLPYRISFEFCRAVVFAFVGLEQVLTLKGINACLARLSPAGIAHCLAVVFAEVLAEEYFGPPRIGSMVAGLRLVADLLDTAWGNAPDDELQLVLAELASAFAVIARDDLCGGREASLRFYVFFLERDSLDYPEDLEEVDFFLELDDIQDEPSVCRYRKLVAHWFSG